MDLQWEPQDVERLGREGAERSRRRRQKRDGHDGRWYASSIALRAWAGKVAWVVGYSVFWAVVIGLFVEMGG